MGKFKYIILVFLLLLVGGVMFYMVFSSITPNKANNSDVTINEFNKVVMENNKVVLPQPQVVGGMSLTEALSLRRSVRSYTESPLSITDLSQLLWSAQGITNDRGFKTAPSAGATFPIEMFVMVNMVEGLQKGIYHYNPRENTLEVIHTKDVSAALTRASHSQSMISDAGAVLIFGAVFERTTARYGDRGERYVYNEIGHASQNVHLQAAALDLGTVVIGAYRDEEVEEILNLDPDIRVLYMMPVGNIN